LLGPESRKAVTRGLSPPASWAEMLASACSTRSQQSTAGQAAGRGFCWNALIRREIYFPIARHRGEAEGRGMGVAGAADIGICGCCPGFRVCPGFPGFLLPCVTFGVREGDVLMCPSEILLPFIPTPLQQIGSETLIAGRLRVRPPVTHPRAQRIELERAKRTGRSGTTLSYWNSMLVNQLPAGAP